ncbi:MAG: hypothetical protein ACU84Q_12090 [Gammaproteobacteria bacterium]
MMTRQAKIIVLLFLGSNLLFYGAALRAADSRKAINLSFTIGDLTFSEQKFINTKLRCDTVLIEGDRIACPKAMISFTSPNLGRYDLVTSLAWESTKNTYHLNTQPFSFAGGVASVALSRALKSQQFEIKFDKTDAKHLWELSLEFLPESLHPYEVESGTVSGRVACDAQRFCEIEISTEALNFSGINAAEDAALAIDVNFTAETARLRGSISLKGGAIYIEPGFSIGNSKPGFLIGTDIEPITIEMDLNLPSAGRTFGIRQASVSHPGVVEMSYVGDLGFNDKISWKSLMLEIEAPQIEKFYETYVQPVIFGTTVDSLETSGSISARLSGRDNEITDLSIDLSNTYFDDSYDRFALYGLDGEFVLSSSETSRYSSVNWEGASIYGISLGAGKIDWGSQARNVWISAWDEVSVFDGTMNIGELSVTDFGTRDARVILSGTLSPVSMPEVMASFGLPAMAGKVSAAIPQLSFKRNKLVLDGAIEIKLFNGVMRVTNLEIAELFSSVPRLYANVEADGLDLATLTSTFSFGNISGTLDGHVKDLRLEAWQPLSFDAHFATREDDSVRHRISRQAVDNLGRIGAQTSVLSSGWLRFIPNYSYGRLGLGCKLERGFCNMSGVAEADDDGFYVLTQGGLLPPWINIKGKGKLVSWRNLLDGIQQISTGEVAVKIGAEAPQTVQ